MKKGARDYPKEPYVRLPWKIIDSAAFKTLSPSAVWLYIQLLRQFKISGGYSRLILPYADVRWKLSFKAFDRARGELIVAGFLRIIQPGGLLKNPAIYSTGDACVGWINRSIELLSDPTAGQTFVRRLPNGGTHQEWRPSKVQSESQINIVKARAALQKMQAQHFSLNLPTGPERV
jgi:hypothetical protein